MTGVKNKCDFFADDHGCGFFCGGYDCQFNPQPGDKSCEFEDFDSANCTCGKAVSDRYRMIVELVKKWKNAENKTHETDVEKEVERRR